MRSLKFRAYDSVHKRFMYLTMHPTSIQWASPEYMAQAPLMNGESLEGVGFAIEGWQQFTGLKDRNRVEIYEGDVIRHHYHRENMVIVFYDKRASFGGIDSNKKFVEMYPIDKESFEIIGNIYEHPHLLNGEKQ